MSWYIVRVILHNDRLAMSYAALHQKMADIGFLRQMTSDNGTIVELPHGMYFGESYLDTPSVRDAVKNVAFTVDSNISVLAMQVPSWAAFNLTADFPLQALSLLSLGGPR